jgi:hypothetical protein
MMLHNSNGEVILREKQIKRKGKEFSMSHVLIIQLELL